MVNCSDNTIDTLKGNGTRAYKNGNWTEAAALYSDALFWSDETKDIEQTHSLLLKRAACYTQNRDCDRGKYKFQVRLFPF